MPHLPEQTPPLAVPSRPKRSMVAAWGAFAAHRPGRAAALALLLPVALFYAPVLVGLATFPDGDFTHHFLPFSLFQAEALRAGRLPLWNPHTYAGHPFLADTQAAVYYPISNLLLLITLPWRSAAARLYFLQVEAVVHTMLAGVFTFLLLRGLGARRWAALLGGLTFALSGYLLSYPPLQLAVLRSAVWLPPALWLLWRASQGREVAWSSAGAGLALASSFLAGHPQTFLYVVYASGAWALLLAGLIWRDQGARAALIYAGWALLFGGAVAATVSAAQLWPSLEFSRLSVRASVDYAFVSGGFPLQDAWQLLLPKILTYYSPLYMGAVALGLACLAVAGARYAPARRGAVAIFFALLALLALGLSFGGNGPLYPLAWRFLPGWNLFRGQERTAYLVAFALSVLAGLGAQAVTTLPYTTRRRVGLAFAAVVLAAVYACGLLWQLPGRTIVSPARFLWIAVVTMALAAALALLLWLPGWSLRRSIILTGIAVLPLFIFGLGPNIEVMTPAARTRVAPEVEALQVAVVERAEASVGLPGRVYNEYRAYEDYAMRAGVEDLWGSSPLRLARYATLNEEFPLDRWWALTGVEHVLTWRRDLFVPSTLLAEYPQERDTTYLHRLSEPAPRAWPATGVQLADDEQARALLADHAFDLRTTLLLPPESGAQAGALPAVEGSVRLEALSPERLRVEVTTSGDALLYLSQVWMPGWRVETPEVSGARILGMRAFEPQRAHLTFLAVPVPAGEHTFDLVYDPESVRAGQIRSVASLLALGVAAVATWQRRRRAR